MFNFSRVATNLVFFLMLIVVKGAAVKLADGLRENVKLNINFFYTFSLKSCLRFLGVKCV